jgi:hypothetical protein
MIEKNSFVQEGFSSALFINSPLRYNFFVIRLREEEALCSELLFALLVLC